MSYATSRCSLVHAVRNATAPHRRLHAHLLAVSLALTPAALAAFPSAIDLSSLLPANGGDGSVGFALNGTNNSDQAGRSVSQAGDINGDGIDDFLIGAPYGDPGGHQTAGETYVVFGRTTGFPAELALSSLYSGDGSAGFVVNGLDEFDYSGRSVSAAGDVNGDGVDDVLIGANNARAQAGQSYIVFGSTDDADCDDVPAALDNCLTSANADQRDSDADGIGNLCDQDLNDDCFVNFSDLGVLKAVFFTSDDDADFDGSGLVNFVDLGMMKGRFFTQPGPSGLPNLCDL